MTRVPIEEIDGAYAVDERGLVYRVKAGPGAKAGHALTPSFTGRGYAQVVLTADGRRLQRYVHRLVCEAFHGPAPTPEHEVNHVNGDKADNRAVNLEWVTHKENQQHAGRLGLMARGERNPSAKLSADDVRAIRRRCAAGESQDSVAAAWGIRQSNVSKIVRRLVWRHV